MVLLVTALCFAPSGLGQTTPAPAPQLDCTDALTDLLPCLDYVTNSSPNISAECCTGLGAVKASNPLCLCTFLNANQSASLGINVTRALELPTFCKVQANPADCGGEFPPSLTVVLISSLSCASDSQYFSILCSCSNSLSSVLWAFMRRSFSLAFEYSSVPD